VTPAPFLPLLAQAQFSPDYLLTQLFNGLVNGGFFALLALGLSIIFGMLRIVNFAHGAMYMLGAFVAYYGAQFIHLPFFAALIVAPILVGLFGLLIEVFLLRRLYDLDPLYNLLFTFALVLIIEDGMRLAAGALGSPYETPALLPGATNLGFTLYPTYRLFTIVVCILVCAIVYVVLERTMLGARIRAATEKPELTRAFGIDTSRLFTVVFALGSLLAALGGALGADLMAIAPGYPLEHLVYFLIVVAVGGFGSVNGPFLAALLLGVGDTACRILAPQFGAFFVYAALLLILLARPTGLFGRA